MTSSTHPLDIQVDPGGEGYVKFGKAKLHALGTLRKDLRLPVMQKHYQIDSSTRVSIKSAEWGDKIQIKAGTPLRYVYLDSLNKDFSGGAITSDTYPPGGQAWYANPHPPPNYEAFVSGTQPPGYVGVGTSTLTTYNHVVVGLAETNGEVRTALNDGPNVVVSASDTRTTGPFDTTGLAELYIDVGPTNADMLALIEGGHPTFTPWTDYLIGNKEIIVVARLEYTYTGDVSDVRTDPWYTAAASPSGITTLNIAKLTSYKYVNGVWQGPTDIPIAVDALRSWSTTTYFGNVGIVSKNPIHDKTDDDGDKELNVTYQAQMDLLDLEDPTIAPLTTNRLMKAISDLIR